MQTVIFMLTICAASAIWGAVALNEYGNWHITEAERTEAFNEGYDTAACEIHRLQLGKDIRKCRDKQNPGY